MLPLLIHIENQTTNARTEAVFSTSPVRVGRNQLNDLVLNESFVSQWHAIVRFDASNTVYVDLGSTNGTMVNGHRVPKNVEVPINEQADLRIGPVRLHFVRAQAPVDVGPGRASVGGDDLAGGFTKTVFMAAGQVPAAQPHAAPAAAAPQGPQLGDVISQLKPYYQQYRGAFGHALQVLQQQLQATPPAQREHLLAALFQHFPQLAKEAELRDAVVALGVPANAIPEADATQFVQRLTAQAGQSHGAPPPNIATAMERIGAMLEVYSQAYVELRKGSEQFGQDMAVQVTHDPSPLRRSQDAHAVLRYLLDWSADAGGRIHELNKAFADLALHQVALLNGLIEGVRSLLEMLSPVTLSGDKGAAVATRGLGTLLFPWKTSGLWFEFVAKHRELLEEDRFTREVFGRSFAKAYYTVTGGSMNQPRTGGRSFDDRTLPPGGSR